MGRAPVYNGINRAGLYSSKALSFHPGPAVMRASNHLAVVFLFLGVGFAAFLSGSLEQRIGNLFSFGLLPAISVYAGGHVLGQLLVFGVDPFLERFTVTDLRNWADRKMQVPLRCIRALVPLLRSSGATSRRMEADRNSVTN